MELNDAAMDEWKCPICLELLYKPCVNTCGHVFCFWCMHRAMDPFTPSQCPLCRAEYAHFPQVCEQLHFFLLKAFPAQYREREEDTREEETTSGVYSLELHQQHTELQQASAVQQSSPEGWSKDQFSCSDCCKLLYNPVVLNCGHAVCHATCRPQAPASDDPVCPRCDAPSVGTPAICTQWQDQLVQLLPEDMRLRKIDATAAGASPQKVAAAEASGPSGGQAAAAAASNSQQPAPDTDANATARLRRRLLLAIRQDFSHHGVGCDACGLYPIKGRRYTCTDCPDKVGFDLCGKCHDKELHITGRFNQQHTPDHNMRLVKPMPTLFHVVQAANPELSMAQIRQLTGLAFDRHEESLLGQAMRPQANPAQTQSSDAAEVAAGGRSSSGSQRAEGAAARATTDADSRANVWGPLYIQTRLETQARAEAERQEASTWANDFIANAQQAADDAEANAQASTRAAQVVEQEAAPAATDDVAPPSGMRLLGQRMRSVAASIAASANSTEPQTHRRAQHDPTGQNWRWNLAGAAGGPASSRARSPTSRGSSPPRSGGRLTPRRPRESSGADVGLPRPWRRRRLQADSPAEPPAASHTPQSEDSGAGQSGSGSWRRLLPSFLGSMWSSAATPQQESAATEEQQHMLVSPRAAATPTQQTAASDPQVLALPQQQQQQQSQNDIASQQPASTHAEAATPSLNSSHTEEQPQPSPPLPSVPNVWDDVAAIEGSAPNVDSGDDNLAHSQGDQNMAVAGSGHLVDNSADYAQGGDDTDMEHDAMLLVLHAMQRRSSERGEAAGQGQDRGVVRQNEQALRADTSRDTSSDEQYWRAVEAAGEAAFVNGTEGDELPDLDADWGSLG